MSGSIGLYMMITGGAGVIVCLILLCLLPGIFRRKRERVLREMELE